MQFFVNIYYTSKLFLIYFSILVEKIQFPNPESKQ